MLIDIIQQIITNLAMGRTCGKTTYRLLNREVSGLEI